MTEAQAIFTIIKFIFEVMFIVWMVTRLYIFIRDEWDIIKEVAAELYAESKGWVWAFGVFTVSYIILNIFG